MQERYDAVLLHGYMSPQDNLGHRNSMQIDAVEELYYNGKVDKIFIAGGNYWGEDNPSYSEVVKDRLIRRGVNKADIIINPQADTTSEEVDLFLSEAEKSGWSRVAGVSNQRHTERVVAVYNNRSIDSVDQLKAEEILGSIIIERRYPYGNFLRNLGRWQNIFRASEIPKRWLTRYGQEKLLEKLAKKESFRKGKSKIDK